MVDRRQSVSWFEAIRDVRVIIAAMAALLTALATVGTNALMSDTDGHGTLLSRLDHLDSLATVSAGRAIGHGAVIDSLVSRQNRMVTWREDTVGPSLRYLVCMEMELDEALRERRMADTKHCRNLMRTVRQLLGNGDR